MRIILPRNAPRYDNVIFLRPDYESRVREDETDAQVDARTRLYNCLLDVPPQMRYDALRGIDRRDRRDKIPMTEAKLFGDASLSRESNLCSNLLPIWRHGERRYSVQKGDPFLVTPTDDKILSLFADNLVPMSREDIEVACHFENAPRAIKNLDERYGGMFKPGIRRPGTKARGGYLICVKQQVPDR